VSANAQKQCGNKSTTKAISNSMSRSSTNEREGLVTLPPSEAEISTIVEAGGGKYVGVLMAIPNKMESIILFISPQTRTTLGVPISRLTVEAVREQLAESNAAFAGLSSKSRDHKDIQ
jgi:hypothetical protein